MATLPAPTISLNKNTFTKGEVMRLKCRETLSVKRSWIVTDTNQVWTRDNGAGTTDYTYFTSIAQRPAADHVVKVKLVRESDGAQSPVVSLAYDVASAAVNSPTVRYGVSCSDEDHQLPLYMSDGVTPSWRTGHCYDFGRARDTNKGPPAFKMESVCMSDSDNWDHMGYGSDLLTNSQVDTIIGDIGDYHDDFPDMIVRYSWGNEVDRHVNNYANFIASVGKIKDAMVSTWPNGYGGWITMWTSFTGFCFRGGKVPEIDKFKGLAAHVYGFGVDIYPPGRDLNPVAPVAYSDFIDPVVNKMAEWGVKNYAAWETGVPVPTNNTYPTNGKTRPEYMVGLRNYAISKMKDKGINTTEMIYWDQNIGTDNRLFHDGTKTAKAWTNWK